jgi:hypothetical protein
MTPATMKLSDALVLGSTMFGLGSPWLYKSCAIGTASKAVGLVGTEDAPIMGLDYLKAAGELWPWLHRPIDSSDLPEGYGPSLCSYGHDAISGFFFKVDKPDMTFDQYLAKVRELEAKYDHNSYSSQPAEEEVCTVQEEAHV